MKIKDLKGYVDRAYENGKDESVEFWIKLDDESLFLGELDSVGQFNTVPDMTITVKPANCEGKIYTAKVADPEEFRYREAYNKLRASLYDICSGSLNITKED